MATMVFVVRRLRAIDCRLRWRVASRITKAMPTGGEISARVAQPTARRDWSKRRDRSRLWDKRTLFVFRPSPALPLYPTSPPPSLSLSISSPRLARAPASSARTPPRPSPPARAARPPSRSRRRPRDSRPPADTPFAVAPGCPGISPGARVPATSDMNSAYAASISVPALAVLPRFRLRWPPAPRPDLPPPPSRRRPSRTSRPPAPARRSEECTSRRFPPRRSSPPRVRPTPTPRRGGSWFRSTRRVL